MPNKFYSGQFKYEVLLAYKNENYTVEVLTAMYRIPNVTLYNWVEKFEMYGLSGLENAKTWKSYSKELKEAAVKDHILY